MIILNHFAPGLTPRPAQVQVLQDIERLWSQYDVFVVRAAVGCHVPEQQILMFDGTVKAAQNIRVGDQLMGPDSLPRTVLRLHEGVDYLYTITPKRGPAWTVTGNHVLNVKQYINRKMQFRNITVLDLLAQSKFRQANTWQWQATIEYTQKELPIDPWWLGAWLGDGHQHTTHITSMHSEVIKPWTLYGTALGMSVTEQSLPNNKASTWRLTTKRGAPNPLLEKLKELNLIKNKHIPYIYKTASLQQRLELLAGLFDTDGHIKNNTVEIIQKRKSLAEDILYVMRSVGMSANMRQKIVNGVPYWRIIGSTAKQVPPCKRIQLKKCTTGDNTFQKFTITPAGIGRYVGFTVDKDQLYVLDTFTVTHNTGKTYLADCVAKWNGSGVLTTPTNALLRQYQDDLAGYATPPSRGGYSKADWDVAKQQYKDSDFKMCNYFHLLALRAYGRLQIFDECFPAETLIVTDYGCDTIHNIAVAVTRGKDIRVRSYNEATRTFEYKLVTNAWAKLNCKPMIRFYSKSGGTYISTANHKWLTTDGWKLAEALQPGDYIIGEGRGVSTPTADQYQVLLGSLLGDGSIQYTSHRDSYRCKFVQGEKQLDYLKWKASLFSTDGLRQSVSGYGTNAVYTTSTSTFIGNLQFKNVISDMDARGLAIWYMDDGSGTKSPDGTMQSIKLACNAFSETQTTELCTWFVTKFNLDPIKFQSKGYWNIRFNKESAIKFIELIAPYMHQNLQHKADRVVGTYVWDTAQNPKSFKIHSVDVLPAEEIVYDIEVEHNHNFLVKTRKTSTTACVAHNCHSLLPMLQDQRGIVLWRHLDPWPDKLRTAQDVLLWAAKYHKDKKLSKLVQLLSDAGPEEFTLSRGTDEYRGQEREFLRVHPLTPRDNPPVLWPPGRVRKLVLMSATISAEDIYDLGLDTRRVCYLDPPSAIPAEVRPIKYDGVADMSYKYQRESLPVLVEYLRELLARHPERGVIHTTYALARQLRQAGLLHDRLVYHGPDNALSTYRRWLSSSAPGAVLVACGMEQGIDLKYDRARWQVATKIAYPSLTDPAVAAKLRHRPQWYYWQAARHLQQLVGRVCRGPDDYGITYIADQQFERLYKNKSLWFPWFSEALI